MKNSKLILNMIVFLAVLVLPAFAQTAKKGDISIDVRFDQKGSGEKPVYPMRPSDSAENDQGSIPAGKEYTIGVDDVLEISVLQPEEFVNIFTVSPDGFISFPYIGNVEVKDKTLGQVQEDIQSRLADGYLRYPVVLVTLKESRSRKFFVYGEVMKPGMYPIDPNTTVLKAISMAGGFTRFGSSSHVKVLRSRSQGPGYDLIKINIKDVMNGNSQEDILLKRDDIVVVSEGVF